MRRSMLIEVTVDDSNSFMSFSVDILDVKRDHNKLEVIIIPADILDVKRDHDKLEVVIIPKYLKELTHSS